MEEIERIFTLTGMVVYLNENFKKQSGKLFTTSDVQSYIRREYLPKYLGDFSIKRDKKFKDFKIYRIIQNDKKEDL